MWGEGRSSRKNERPSVSNAAGHSGKLRPIFTKVFAIYDLDREGRQKPDREQSKREWKETVEDSRDGQPF
jgi:hypothetical protein